MKTTGTIRLNKFISDSGFCSRREADIHIEKGNVFVNKKRAAVGDIVKTTDRVLVNGHNIEVQTPDDLILIALNKPMGITSTTETGTENNIIEFVNHSHRIFPIGRLDKDSQGLILLTNNGDLVNKILRAGNRHEKEYVVTVNRHITQDFIEGMANGVPLLGTKTKKCKVEMESPFIFRITLIQGLNRQIRRMCSYFGYEVVKLERVRIMNITLKRLPLGDWRDLSEQEVKELLKMLSQSSSAPRKERSFSKNKEYRKTASGHTWKIDDGPKAKSSRFFKKKNVNETSEVIDKPKKSGKSFKSKSTPKGLREKIFNREKDAPQKLKPDNSAARSGNKTAKASNASKKPTGAKPKTNPKSFKSYRQNSSKK